MKEIALTILLVSLTFFATGQVKYVDRGGHISFFSEAPLEDIEAHSHQAMSILNVSTGEVVAVVSMRSFQFDKSLMQEHFNENYIESDKYPKSMFQGTLTNASSLDLQKSGKQLFKVRGDLLLHGVTNNIEADIELEKVEGGLRATTSFPIALKDYNIKIPRIVVKNIAEVVQVTITFHYKPMNP